jgi:hypothetical protein
METTSEGSSDLAAPAASLGRRAPQLQARADGPVKRIANGVARFALTGLSTMEVITLAVAYVAVMGFLWMSGTAEPERLVTNAGFRSAWVIVALALLRPMTWIPYAAPFVAFRKLSDALFDESRPLIRNAVAHLLTIGSLAGVLWLLTFVMEGVVSAVLSGLAFLTGSGSLSTLGEFRGDWNPARAAGVVAIVLVVRLVLPPLARDLGFSQDPVLWFGSGSRGRFDRIAFLVVVAGSVLLVGIGAFLARSG